MSSGLVLAIHARRWQHQIFWTAWLTYFAYYLCRLNLPVANAQLRETFQWSKTQVGSVMTSLLVAYAVGQFVNGQLADRFGSRAIASLGVFGSVAMNLAVFAVALTIPGGKADSVLVLWLFIAFWGLNGFFQAMGWPSIVRLMAHWIPTAQRGKSTAVMGTSYMFGNAFTWLISVLLTGYYVERWSGDWRSVFLVPAVLFGAVGICFLVFIRNRPEDVGLEPVGVGPGRSGGTSSAPTSTIATNVARTLSNPYLWVVAASFFMLDVTRYGFVNWLPDYFEKPPASAAASALLENFKTIIKVCILPLGGIPGMLLAGWLTDKWFGGRRAPVIAVLLFVLGVTSIVFPRVDRDNTWLVIAVVFLIGFCTYGPHILMVGHAAQDFGRKAGAGGAAGFIDAFGYIGAALTGIGAGALIDRYGYGVTFVTFGSAAILGALLACIIWTVRPGDEGEHSTI